MKRLICIFGVALVGAFKLQEVCDDPSNTRSCIQFGFFLGLLFAMLVMELFIWMQRMRDDDSDRSDEGDRDGEPDWR